MNTNELRSERVRQGKDKAHMAGVIRKGVDAYSKKERGVTGFTVSEMLAITIDLKLNCEKFDAIFFDSKLPFGKF